MSDPAAKPSEPPPAEGGKASDRRTDERHFACFPAHIQRSSGSLRMALIRDLSVSGALLLTREKLEVGETLRLSLYLSDDSAEPRPTSGHVVRVEPRTADKAEVWHHAAAVHFDEPLTGAEAEIKDLAERQAALGVPRD
jgi:hypothetical protein